MITVSFDLVKEFIAKTRKAFINLLNDNSWKNAMTAVYLHDIKGYSFKQIENLKIQYI